MASIGQQRAASRLKPYIPSDEEFRIYFARAEQHRTTRDVGEEFGKSNSTVWEIERRVAAHLYEKNIDHARFVKQKIETGLWHIIGEAYAAWSKSKAGLKSKTEVDGYNAQGEVATVSKTFKESAGENAYLATMLSGYTQLRQLWGLDTEKAQEILDDVLDDHRAGSGSWEEFQAKIQAHKLREDIAAKEQQLEAIQAQLETAGEN